MSIKYPYHFILLMIFLTGCSKKQDIPFTGFEPRRQNSKISLDTISIKPQLTQTKKFPNVYFTWDYWDVYCLNKAYNISHMCAAHDGLAEGAAFGDSLIINDNRFSITDAFNGKNIAYRIFSILKFKFNEENYFIISGQDMDRNAALKSMNDIVFLIKDDKQSAQLLCPPLTLLNEESNTHSFYPYYFNDFNNDKTLDFLQWNQQDTVSMYSIIASTFVKQKEFIKIRKSNDQFFIDKKHSHWPYAYFKSEGTIRDNSWRGISPESTKSEYYFR